MSAARALDDALLAAMPAIRQVTDEMDNFARTLPAEYFEWIEENRARLTIGLAPLTIEDWRASR